MNHESSNLSRSRGQQRLQPLTNPAVVRAKQVHTCPQGEARINGANSKDHHTPSHRHQDSSSDRHTPARHLHDANTAIMVGTAHQNCHNTSNTVKPGTAPCQHQLQTHHNASDTVEPGTAPCRHQVHLDANAIAESGTAPYHHQFHHGAGVTGTAPSHQQACPAAQHLLATSSTEDNTMYMSSSSTSTATSSTEDDTMRPCLIGSINFVCSSPTQPHTTPHQTG